MATKKDRIIQILLDLIKRTGYFYALALVQAQWFGTKTCYDNDFCHEYGK